MERTIPAPSSRRRHQHSLLALHYNKNKLDVKKKLTNTRYSNRITYYTIYSGGYGLHLLHGTYPAAMASSRVLNSTNRSGCFIVEQLE